MLGFFRNTWMYTYYKIAKATLALTMYGNPAKDMFIIGITGTNGKTTSSFMIHHIFNTLVSKSFLIGTNEIKIGQESQDNPTKMTSLDPFDLQPYLAKAYDA